MPRFRAAGEKAFRVIDPFSLSLGNYDMICAPSTAGKSALAAGLPGLMLDIDPIVHLLFGWSNLRQQLSGDDFQSMRDRCFNTAYLLAQALASQGRRGQPWQYKLLDYDIRPRFTWPDSSPPRVLFVELTPIRLLAGWKIRQEHGEPRGVRNLPEAREICALRRKTIDAHYRDCDVAVLGENVCGSYHHSEHLVELFSETRALKPPVEKSGRVESTYQSVPKILSFLLSGCSVPFPFPSPTRTKGKK